MKVFILCGGYGTRLDHEGKNNPKALIKIGREPIIIHLIKIFLKYKYTEFVLCMGYKQHLIKKFLLKGFYGEYFVDLITDCKLNNCKILELPFIENKRKSGDSKTSDINKFNYLITTYFYFMEFVKNCLKVKLNFKL